MRYLCRHISFRRLTRFGRSLGSCALVPVLLVSSVTSQAILIHNHYGHETHVHAVAAHDLDAWQENSEHQHEEHEHDDRPADSAPDEDQSILIVLDLPVALPRAMGLSCGLAVSNTAPASKILAIDTTAAANGRPRIDSRTSSARLWRARSLVADILLTSHALLL